MVRTNASEVTGPIPGWLINRTASTYGVGSSRVAQMERGIEAGFSIYLPKPTQAETAHPKREDRLARDSPARGRATLPDLQPTARLLHTA
jgi:hypothetical protein